MNEWGSRFFQDIIGPRVGVGMGRLEIKGENRDFLWPEVGLKHTRVSQHLEIRSFCTNTLISGSLDRAEGVEARGLASSSQVSPDHLVPPAPWDGGTLLFASHPAPPYCHLHSDVVVLLISFSLHLLRKRVLQTMFYLKGNFFLIF